LERLALHIESLIFTSEYTISLNQIKACVEETIEQSYKNVDIKKAIDSLIEKYKSEDYSFEIVEIANGYKFLTKGSYHNTVSSLIKKNNQKRLSKAALETLSIVAYKQPVTKSDIEGIRGVNCDYTIQKLLEKELVAIAGRAEGPGRPLIYATSEKFMDYFGIKDVSSLPKLKDIKVPEIQIGEPAPIEEDYGGSVEANQDKDDPESIEQVETLEPSLETENVVGNSANQSDVTVVITEEDPEPIERVLVKEEDHITNVNVSNEEE